VETYLELLTEKNAKLLEIDELKNMLIDRKDNKIRSLGSRALTREKSRNTNFEKAIATLGTVGQAIAGQRNL